MAITNQGKIDQLIIDNNSFDIDLPVDATPSIASLTVSGAISEGGTSLADKYTSTSVIPNNAGEIKTKYRVALKGYTGDGSPTWYYKLLTLPVNNSGNYASVIINGRIGGWVSNNMSSIYSLAWNRDTPGFAMLNIGAKGAASDIFSICDLVMYVTSSNTAEVYIKCKAYFTFDFDIEAFQSGITINYDGTYTTTTPSGTLADSLSSCSSRLQLIRGVLYINGTAVSLNGHNHDDSYLGKTATAADSSKLNGQAASYYLNYNNLTNKPTIDNNNQTVKGNGTAFGANAAVNIVGGGATTVTADTANNKITISSTDTTYTNGTGLSLSGTTFSVSQANASTILNLLTTGDSDPQDNDWYISQYAGGGSSTTSFHRRPVSKLYNYIKGKTDTLYLGKTSKATDADKLDGNDSSYYLNYNNLSNKPSIPTVNNGTLKIQVEGTDLGTFTANQSGNTTVNITADSLGLSSALKYRGVATTTKPSAGKYIQTVIGSTTYYVSITSSGTATQQNAQLGDVISIGVIEYVCTTAGASGTNVFTQIGDESSYALKTKSITGTGVLGGGGNLTADRTITHNKVLGTAKTTADVYKIKIDEYGHISEATSAGLGTAAYTNSTAYASSNHNHSGVYQPLDADLTAIAGLTGTSGLLKKTAADTWTLDTNTYVLTNDSRLSDARTPKSHTHGNITNDGKIASDVVTNATGILVYDSNNAIQRATAAQTRSIIGAGTSNLTLGTTATTALKGSTTIKAGSSGVDVVQTASWDSTTGTLTLTSTKLSLG